MKNSIQSVAAGLLLCSVTAFADYDKGIVAFFRFEYAEAYSQFRAAAEQGHARAQASLGSMYAQGWGVPKDTVEAVRWYRAAAEQGDVDGQHGLGGMYRDGKGVPKNYAEAVRWYRKAAKQGNSHAQIDLGLMYYKVKGVQNDVQAYHWFNLAAAQGQLRARDWRDEIEARMTPEQIAEAQKLSREFLPK